MIVDIKYVVLLVYTGGVLLTGIYLERTFGEFEEISFFSLVLVMIVGWSVYFTYSVMPKFEGTPEEREDV